MNARIFALLPLFAITLAQAEPTPTAAVDSPLPTRLLSCGTSVITEIGGRLEGDHDFSTGTSVFYRNGGGGVSYDKVPPVIRSRVGDHVLVCLVFVPRNCPRGDTRGKFYTTTNLRTLESWTLMDSQHSCGGA